MKNKNTAVVNQNKNILWIALGTALILMIPLVMMQVSDEWDWKLSDFIVIGALLFGTGFLFDVLSRKFSKHKVAIGIALLIAMLLVYVQLAVGIIDSLPFAGH